MWDLRCERLRGFQEGTSKRLQDPNLQESPSPGQKRETEAVGAGETDLEVRRHEGDAGRDHGLLCELQISEITRPGDGEGTVGEGEGKALGVPEFK